VPHRRVGCGLDPRVEKNEPGSTGPLAGSQRQVDALGAWSVQSCASTPVGASAPAAAGARLSSTTWSRLSAAVSSGRGAGASAGGSGVGGAGVTGGSGRLGHWLGRGAAGSSERDQGPTATRSGNREDANAQCGERQQA
jgi:hypothetical protein